LDVKSSVKSAKHTGLVCFGYSLDLLVSTGGQRLRGQIRDEQAGFATRQVCQPPQLDGERGVGEGGTQMSSLCYPEPPLLAI